MINRVNNFEFDEPAYLQRIGLNSPITPDPENLERIVRGQGFNIPFENFDIMLGRNISLAPEHIFQKLVSSPRGGYCFELNGLLLMALQHFGFDAIPLLARVHLRGDPTSRTHQLSLVTLDGQQWIVDVGFGGGGLLAPIPFELNRVFEQDGLRFRLVITEPYDYMLQLYKNDHWQNLYSFDLTHVGEADIAMGNFYTSTHPACFFTYSRIATIPVQGGRISLKDFLLNKRINGKAETIVLPQGPEYLEALKLHFRIDLKVPYQALKPIDDQVISS